MTQEEKQLLFKDLCARLPYGVKIFHNLSETPITFNSGHLSQIGVYKIKPYLRPMSSMTKEEIKYKLSNFFRVINTNIEGLGYIPTLNTHSAIKYIDWLIANHFDIHGLIPMGLALEAKEGMYKIE